MAVLKPIFYRWTSGESTNVLELRYVPGTRSDPYRFGDGAASRLMEVGEFWLATTPTTRALWTLVMGEGENSAIGQGPSLPVENVSWDELHRPGGFLERINANDIREQLSQQTSRSAAVLRLPSEAEWEYAARGGPHWRDGFRYSGSNDIDLVAWCDRKWGDCTQKVALKAPNQLGLYDMSGNIGSGAKTRTPRRLKICPQTAVHLAVTGRNASCGGDAFTIGPWIARSRNGTKSTDSFTTAALVFGWC